MVIDLDISVVLKILCEIAQCACNCGETIRTIYVIDNIFGNE